MTRKLSRAKLPFHLSLLVLVLAWTLAGFSKYFSIELFDETLSAFVPEVLVPVLVVVIPMGEIAVAGLIASARFRRIGLLASLAFLLVFVLVSIVVEVVGIEVSCACFGSVSQKPLGIHTLPLQLILLALSGLLLFLTKQASPGKRKSVAHTALLSQKR